MPGIGLRADWDAERVRRAARLATDAGQVRRLLSIAAIYEGMSRTEAARLSGMDRQTLRDWVHRFNAEGPSGLIDRKARRAAAGHGGGDPRRACAPVHNRRTTSAAGAASARAADCPAQACIRATSPSFSAAARIAAVRPRWTG